LAYFQPRQVAGLRHTAYCSKRAEAGNEAVYYSGIFLMRFTLAILALAMTLPAVLRPPKPALAATPVEQVMPAAFASAHLQD